MAVVTVVVIVVVVVPMMCQMLMPKKESVTVWFHEQWGVAITEAVVK